MWSLYHFNTILNTPNPLNEQFSDIVYEFVDIHDTQCNSCTDN